MISGTDPAVPTPGNPGGQPPPAQPRPGALPADGGEGARAAGESRPGFDEQGCIGRAQARYAAARRRVDEASQKLQESRGRITTVDVVFSVQEDDRDAGGSLLGGAIAFRMFLWMLPACLLVVAGLGFGAAASSTAPGEMAKYTGFSSLAAQSVNQAAQQSESGRWFALLFGSVFLYTTSVGLVKALYVTHALIWGVPVPRIAHKPRAAAELILALAAVAAATSLAAVIRSRSSGIGLGAMLVIVAVYGAVWWAYSTRLPHGDASAVELLPGAVLLGLGAEIMHLVAVYYLGSKLTHSSVLYGTLGASAAILFSLYLVGRLVVGATVLNATLWERRHREQSRPEQSRPEQSPPEQALTPGTQA